MRKIFFAKQKRYSFLLDTCLAKLTLSNYLGPHNKMPGGLVFIYLPQLSLALPTLALWYGGIIMNQSSQCILVKCSWLIDLAITNR